MYAIVKDNNITQLITNPKSIVIGDVRYPAKIFSLWSQSELNNIGIYEVIIDSTNKKDEEYTYADGQVTKSWGTATPKKLEDEDAVDKNGNPVLDEDGVQIINYGLKTQKKRIVKKEASGLLAPTDWYVIKANEVADYNVPENITTFRADVRSKSNEMESQIDACNNVEELKTLYTRDQNGVRPLAEFPEEVV